MYIILLFYVKNIYILHFIKHLNLIFFYIYMYFNLNT